MEIEVCDLRRVRKQIGQHAIENLGRLRACAAAEEEPIGKVVLPHGHRLPERPDAVPHREQGHPRWPEAESLVKARRHQYAAEIATQWRRAAVLLILEQEIAVEIDIVFVESPPPGETEWIDRVNHHDGSAGRRTPRWRQPLH